MLSAFAPLKCQPRPTTITLLHKLAGLSGVRFTPTLLRRSHSQLPLAHDQVLHSTVSPPSTAVCFCDKESLHRNIRDLQRTIYGHDTESVRMHHIEKIVDTMSKTLEQTAVNNKLSTIKDIAALNALNIIHAFPPEPQYNDKYAYRLWMKVVKHLDCLTKVLNSGSPLSWNVKVPLYCRNSMMLLVQAGDDLGDFATITALNKQGQRETDGFDEEQNGDVKQEDNIDFGAKQIPRDKVVAEEIPTNAVRRLSTHDTTQQSESSLILQLKKCHIYHLISDTPSVGFPQYVKVLGQLHVTPYRVWKHKRGDYIEDDEEKTQFIAVIDLSDPLLSIWAVALNVVYEDLAYMYFRKTLYSEDPLFNFFKTKKFDIAKLGTLRSSRSDVDTFLDKDIVKMVDATKAIRGYSLDYLDGGTYRLAAKAVSEGWGE